MGNLRAVIRPGRLGAWCWEVVGSKGDLLKSGVERSKDAARIAAGGWLAAKRKGKVARK